MFCIVLFLSLGISQVILWDDHQNRCIGELSYRSNVKAVKLRRDVVAVVLATKVYLYALSDLKVIDSIDTGPNEKGLCALCPSAAAPVLVCPGMQKGHIRVELYDIKKTTVIKAHEGDVACFALSADGTRVATASEKGTLIRIFDTHSGKLLQEVRRGSERAEIYSIAFNNTGQWLAVSSDRGTVHIFKLDEGAASAPASSSSASSSSASASSASSATGTGSTTPASSSSASATGTAASSTSTPASTAPVEKKTTETAEAKNPKSWFAVLSPLLPSYVKSEWSFSHFKVPSNVRNIVAFGSEKNSIVVICADGTYYKALFDPTKPGAECVQESYSRFLNSGDE